MATSRLYENKDITCILKLEYYFYAQRKINKTILKIKEEIALLRMNGV